MKTLREVCDVTHITRRIVQEYERYGLVQPAAKNKYGYLLYDEDTVKKIAMIRFLQNLEFSMEEITKFMKMTEDDKKQTIRTHIDDLERKQGTIAVVLKQAKKIIECIEDTDKVYEVIKGGKQA